MRKDLSKFIIGHTSSILDAMHAINDNFSEVIFVRDSGDVIVGVITDGDVRRGLLSGLEMKDSVDRIMSKNFVSVDNSIDRAEALDLMKARDIRHLPVLDEDRRMVGVHLLRELIGGRPKPNVAVVMAGGKGTRLGTLTEQFPKPMLKVAGRPILERLVLQLVGSGIRTIYISVNFMAEVIRDYFGNGEKFGCEIRYLEESPEKPLGTGGALSLLPRDLKDPILVMNGDLIVKYDFDRLLEFHKEGEYCATVCSRSHIVEIPFGVLNETDGALTSIEEKPALSFKINAGVYLIDPKLIQKLRRDEPISMPAILAEILQTQGSPQGRARVGVFEIQDEWTDVGRKEDLRRAKGLL